MIQHINSHLLAVLDLGGSLMYFSPHEYTLSKPIIAAKKDGVRFFLTGQEECRDFLAYLELYDVALKQEHKSLQKELRISFVGIGDIFRYSVLLDNSSGTALLQSAVPIS